MRVSSFHPKTLRPSSNKPTPSNQELGKDVSVATKGGPVANTGDQVSIGAGLGLEEKSAPVPRAGAVSATAPVETGEFEVRPYYDKAADIKAKDAYYSEIDWSATPDKLFEQLSEKTTETHTNHLEYRPSVHLYPWVDRYPDGTLRSIYSDELMSIEELAAADERAARIERQAENAKVFMQAAFAPAAAATVYTLLEARKLNCEHVVPQSWFDKRETEQGDLHHLFACGTSCNRKRGNLPFDEMKSRNKSFSISDCGNIADKRFTPKSNKGVVARATLYFLLRYPEAIDRYKPSDIDTLIEWHESQPVTLYEKHRNQAIEEIQGNRNPLIDFPEKMSRVNFSLGVRKS